MTTDLAALYGPPRQVAEGDPAVWLVEGHWIDGRLGVVVRILGSGRPGLVPEDHQQYVRGVEAVGTDGVGTPCVYRSGQLLRGDGEELETSTWVAHARPSALRVRIDVDGVATHWGLREMTTSHPAS